MSARLSGAPWLLIEMCAWSLVTDGSAGCSTGAAIDRLKSNPRDGESAWQHCGTRAFIGLDIGKTHHWVCALDGEGKPLLSRKIANDETEIVTLLTTASALAQQLVWAVDIIGAPSAL